MGSLAEWWGSQGQPPPKAMIRAITSLGVVILGLGACQVPSLPSTDLGVWRVGLSTASVYTESDIEAGSATSEGESWSNDHSVDLGLSPWEDLPVEIGVRVSFTNKKDKLTQGSTLTEDESLTLDAVANIRMYGDYTGPLRPWIEGFGGVVYNDTNLHGLGSDQDVGPMFGASIGVSAFVGESVSVETALRYTRWETDLLGIETKNDGFSMIIGLAAWF